MTILSKNDQRGRSMVEMLGVLAIIGVLSVGGISGYSKAMAKFKLTKAQDQMSMILMNIRTAFATSPSYDGLNNGTAISFGIAPNEMFTIDPTKSTIASNSRINNAFGGGTYIYVCGSDGTANIPTNAVACGGTNYDATAQQQFFAISMDNLGREACISLASSDWGTDGLISVIVNDTTVSTEQLPILPMGTNPAGAKSAGELCNTFGKTSQITWVYY